jgi:hypothetical protein
VESDSRQYFAVHQKANSPHQATAKTFSVQDGLPDTEIWPGLTIWVIKPSENDDTREHIDIGVVQDEPHSLRY